MDPSRHSQEVRSPERKSGTARPRYGSQRHKIISDPTRLRSGTHDAAMQGFVFVSSGSKPGFFSSSKTAREYAILRKPRTATGYGAVLEFYPPDFSSPIRVLSMQSLLKVEEVWGSQKKRSGFQLSAVGQRLEITCKIAQERDMWVNAIRRHMTTNPSKGTSASPDDRTGSPSSGEEASEDVFMCKALATLLAKRLDISGKECILDLSHDCIKLFGPSGELDQWDMEEVVHVEMQYIDGLGEAVLFVLKSHNSEQVHSVEALQLSHQKAGQILAAVMMQLQTRVCIKKAMLMRYEEMRAAVPASDGSIYSSVSISEYGSVEDIVAETEGKRLGRSYTDADTVIYSCLDLNDQCGFPVHLATVQWNNHDEPCPLVEGDDYMLDVANPYVHVMDGQTSVILLTWPLNAIEASVQKTDVITITEIIDDGSVFYFEVDDVDQVQHALENGPRAVRSSSLPAAELLGRDVPQQNVSSTPVPIRIVSDSSAEFDSDGEWLCSFTPTRMELVDVATKQANHGWEYSQIDYCLLDPSTELLMMSVDSNHISVSSPQIDSVVESLEQRGTAVNRKPKRPPRPSASALAARGASLAAKRLSQPLVTSPTEQTAVGALPKKLDVFPLTYGSSPSLLDDSSLLRKLPTSPLSPPATDPPSIEASLRAQSEDDPDITPIVKRRHKAEVVLLSPVPDVVSHGIDFIPTLVHRMMAESNPIGEDDVERGTDSEGDGTSALYDNVDGIRKAVAGRKGAVSPYAVVNTQDTDLPLRVTSPGAESGFYADPYQCGIQTCRPSVCSEIYVEANTPTEEEATEIESGRKQLSPKPDDSERIYLEMTEGTDGRRPQPLPRPGVEVHAPEDVETVEPKLPKSPSPQPPPVLAKTFKKQQQPDTWETSVSIVGSHLSTASAYALQAALSPLPPPASPETARLKSTQSNAELSGGGKRLSTSEIDGMDEPATGVKKAKSFSALNTDKPDKSAHMQSLVSSLETKPSSPKAARSAKPSKSQKPKAAKPKPPVQSKKVAADKMKAMAGLAGLATEAVTLVRAANKQGQ